jgi:hypothetical protein
VATGVGEPELVLGDATTRSDRDRPHVVVDHQHRPARARPKWRAGALQLGHRRFQGRPAQLVDQPTPQGAGQRGRKAGAGQRRMRPRESPERLLADGACQLTEAADRLDQPALADRCRAVLEPPPHQPVQWGAHQQDLGRSLDGVQKMRNRGGHQRPEAPVGRHVLQGPAHAAAFAALQPLAQVDPGLGREVGEGKVVLGDDVDQIRVERLASAPRVGREHHRSAIGSQAWRHARDQREELGWRRTAAPPSTLRALEEPREPARRAPRRRRLRRHLVGGLDERVQGAGLVQQVQPPAVEVALVVRLGEQVE